MFSKQKNPLGQKTISIEKIGAVTLKRSARAKHLNIKVRAFKGVQVSVPDTMSFGQAEKIVQSKTTWIEQHLQKIKSLEEKAVIYDCQKLITTRQRTLRVETSAVERLTARITESQIIIQKPPTMETSNTDLQEFVRHVLVETFRLEAKAFLPVRLRELAVQFGFQYKKVFIKNHRSRWGSCSALNNINLSLHLMRLTDELIDYVILHELVHTEIKNHSAFFWNRLSEVCPQYQALRNKLRAHETPYLL